MEFSTPEVSIEVQQQKIYALLDFVMECSRNHRLTSRMLEPENSFVSIMKDAVLDSAMIVDSLTVLSHSEDENEIVNVPEEHVVDSLPKFHPPSEYENEIANVSKEHVADSLPQFHPPRKGLSAVRSFPPGCGRGAPPVRIQHGSKCLQNDGSRTKNRHWYGASTKVVKKSSAASLSGASSCKSRLQSLIIHRTEFEDHKLLEDTMRKTSGNEDKKSIGGEFSREFDNVKFGRERLATGPEPTANRVVVQALTASPNCPWRQGKRMWKSEPSKRIRKGKGL